MSKYRSSRDQVQKAYGNVGSNEKEASRVSLDLILQAVGSH